MPVDLADRIEGIVLDILAGNIKLKIAILKIRKLLRKLDV